MKKTNYFKILVALLFVMVAGRASAQLPPCQPTITVLSSNNGTVNFFASMNYTAVPSYLIWNMGNGVTTTYTNNLGATAVYTANGTYTVNLTYFAPSNCTSTAIYTISINSFSCNINAGFTYTQSGNTYTFVSTTTGTTGSTTYAWNFGDGNTGSGSTVVHTFTNSGVFNVNLTATSGSCSDGAASPVNVCLTTLSVNAANGANGTVNFTATAAPTSTTAYYVVYYGDGSSYTGMSGTFANTYTANGVYTATVILMAPPSCTLYSVTSVTVSNVTNPCNLNASFYQSQSGIVSSFVNTSTGVSGGVTYYWNFGDGNTSPVTSPTHTYASGGTYTVTLTANNNYSYTCIDSTSIVITIPTCTFVPTFSASVGANGNVSFTSNAPLTNTCISYWYYGDGGSTVTYTGNSSSHVYTSNGTFTVTLVTAVYGPAGVCTATTTGVVTLTNVCTADATFSLTPSGTPQFWYAIPGSPGNVAAAQWNWGDGNTSNTLFTSHTYSAAGLYSICLTVTTTCGAVDTYCASWNIYRSANGSDASDGMIEVNVLDPNSVGIHNISATQISFNLLPNPNNGNFHIALNGLSSNETIISVYSTSGQEVYRTNLQSTSGQLEKDMTIANLSSGLYIVRVSNGGQTLTHKIVIAGN